jgi:hypothetical protein
MNDIEMIVILSWFLVDHGAVFSLHKANADTTRVEDCAFNCAVIPLLIAFYEL